MSHGIKWLEAWFEAIPLQVKPHLFEIVEYSNVKIGV